MQTFNYALINIQGKLISFSKKCEPKKFKNFVDTYLKKHYNTQMDLFNVHTLITSNENFNYK